MQLTYAIGDIHGQGDALKALLVLIEEDMLLQPSDISFRIIQMGDMIDRGSNSCEVVEICKNLPERFPEAEVYNIMGNHEKALIDIYNGISEDIGGWFPLEKGFGGGIATLHSYGSDIKDSAVDNFEKIVSEVKKFIPQEHINHLSSLPAYIKDKTYMFVHSGIVPNVPLDEQKEDDLIALCKEKRDSFMESNLKHEKIIVHAHTPRRGGEILHNRVNTDAGAGFNLHLQATVLPEKYNMEEVRILQVKINAPEDWIEVEDFKQ